MEPVCLVHGVCPAPNVHWVKETREPGPGKEMRLRNTQLNLAAQDQGNFTSFRLLSNVTFSEGPSPVTCPVTNHNLSLPSIPPTIPALPVHSPVSFSPWHLALTYTHVTSLFIVCPPSLECKSCTRAGFHCCNLRL